MDNIFEKRHAMLMTEFDRCVMEHPKFAAQIPPNAQIVLQLEGEEAYNHWSRELASEQWEPDQPVVHVHIKGLKPARSRLRKAELEIQK